MRRKLIPFYLHGKTDKAVQNRQTWQKATTDFNKAFIQFAKQCGWVAQSEHRQLLERCEALEKKVQEQEAIIGRLRDILFQKGLGHTELFEHLENSFKAQAEQLNAFMESIDNAAKDKSKLNKWVFIRRVNRFFLIEFHTQYHSLLVLERIELAHWIYSITTPGNHVTS